MPIQDVFLCEIPGPRHACLTTPRTKHIVPIYRAFPTRGLSSTRRLVEHPLAPRRDSRLARPMPKRMGTRSRTLRVPRLQRETERHWMECLAASQTEIGPGPPLTYQ